MELEAGLEKYVRENGHQIVMDSLSKQKHHKAEIRKMLGDDMLLDRYFIELFEYNLIPYQPAPQYMSNKEREKGSGCVTQ